jgi:hypothetical protein
MINQDREHERALLVATYTSFVAGLALGIFCGLCAGVWFAQTLIMQVCG